MIPNMKQVIENLETYIHEWEATGRKVLMYAINAIMRMTAAECRQIVIIPSRIAIRVMMVIRWV